MKIGVGKLAFSIDNFEAGRIDFEWLNFAGADTLCYRNSTLDNLIHEKSAEVSHAHSISEKSRSEKWEEGRKKAPR